MKEGKIAKFVQSDGETYMCEFTIGCKVCGTTLEALVKVYPCEEDEIPVYGHKTYCPKCEPQEEIKVIEG